MGRKTWTFSTEATIIGPSCWRTISSWGRPRFVSQMWPWGTQGFTAAWLATAVLTISGSLWKFMVRVITAEEGPILMKTGPSTGNVSFLEVWSQSVHLFLHTLIQWAFLEHSYSAAPRDLEPSMAGPFFSSPKNKFLVFFIIMKVIYVFANNSDAVEGIKMNYKSALPPFTAIFHDTQRWQLQEFFIPLKFLKILWSLSSFSFLYASLCQVTINMFGNKPYCKVHIQKDLKSVCEVKK